MALVNTNVSDSQIKSTWVRNLKVTQKCRLAGRRHLWPAKRAAETDAERLEEGAAETAEIDPDKRIALKRKAEGDPGDSEMEDSAMNSLAALWHTEDDPDGEIDLLILQQRDRCVASVHETGAVKPVCEEPKTPFPYDECGWDYIDDTSGKLLKNTLVEKARAEEISFIRELGVRDVDRPRDEVVFDTRWVDINKRDENQTVFPQSTGRARIQTSSRLVLFHSDFTARGSAKLADLCN